MWRRPLHRNSCKAFTLIEVMVVLVIIGITAGLAAYYGRVLYHQYTFSAFVRSVENAVEVARMRAALLHSGNKVKLRFTNKEQLYNEQPSSNGPGIYYFQDGVEVRPGGAYHLVAPYKSKLDSGTVLKGDIDIEMLYDENLYKICLIKSDNCNMFYTGSTTDPSNREIRFNSKGYLEGYVPIRILLEDHRVTKQGVRKRRTTNLSFVITSLGEIRREACACNCP